MKTREFRDSRTSDTITVKAELRDSILKAEIDGETLEGALLRTTNGAGLWKVGNKTYRIVAAEQEPKVWAAVDGRVYVFEHASEDEYGSGGASENSVAAPMPGKVIKVLVNNGDEVEEGQAVLIVEAMKMEHTLRAPKAGVVQELHCEEGQQVDAGIPLVNIE